MKPIEVRIEECPTAEDKEAVFRHLLGFNEAHAGPACGRDLVVFARRESEIVGGLLGYTEWTWLFIKYLWVADAFRSVGVGSRLMGAAEQEACTRGCAHAHLDTFSFQALPFYTMLGYSVFGRLEDYPVGHTRFFLQKRNLRPNCHTS